MAWYVSGQTHAKDWATNVSVTWCRAFGWANKFGWTDEKILQEVKDQFPLRDTCLSVQQARKFYNANVGQYGVGMRLHKGDPRRNTKVNPKKRGRKPNPEITRLLWTMT